MSQTTLQLQRLANDLKHRFGAHLKEVVIFGSRARGDASSESDYDCLLIFDRLGPSVKTDLEQLAGQYLLEQGMVLSCIPMNEADLERLRFEPFVLNARKEGIAL